MSRYSIQIYWSSEDEGFWALSPEWPTLSAFGNTREDALSEFEDILDEVILMYQEDHDLPPDPLIMDANNGEKFPLRP